MSTKTLAAGTLKIILPDQIAAKSNVTRANNGSDRFKPLWQIFEVNDAGEIIATYRAAKWLTGIWFETLGKLELDGVAVVNRAAA